MYAFFSSIGIWICLNLFHQFFEQFIFFHLLAGMMLNEGICEDLCINNFWRKFLGNRYWNMNLFTFFHHFIALLSSRQFFYLLWFSVILNYGNNNFFNLGCYFICGDLCVNNFRCKFLGKRLCFFSPLSNSSFNCIWCIIKIIPEILVFMGWCMNFKVRKRL